MNNDSRLSDRVNRELSAHVESDVLSESYRLKDRFSHIWTYPSRKRLMNNRDALLEDISGKVVLDYGCGRGGSSIKYLSKGAAVYGIDISPVYIADATRCASEHGYSSGQYVFQTMDAHKLDFRDGMFDIVIGEGILHHLDAKIALQEIWRVLRPGGRLLLLEPLADNPLLKIFRLMTPRARTEDEEPFTGKSIRKLVCEDKWRSETMYCGVVEAPVAVLTSMIVPRKPDNVLLRVADKIEKFMHKNMLLSAWNQYVLFNLIKK